MEMAKAWMDWRGRKCAGYSAEDRAQLRKLRQQTVGMLIVFSGANALHLYGSHAHGAVAAVQAVVQGVTFTALLMLLWAIAIRSGDEYRRTLLWRSLTCGTAATAGLCTVWGYMELNGVSVPRVPLLMVPFLLIITTTMAKLVVFRRERS
jgi:hypothetical protein